MQANRLFSNKVCWSHAAGNERVMPLRVIDVEKTIAHCESGGIYFVRSPIWHVISHTWSADIRSFSCIIGDKMSQQQHHDTNQPQSYEALFESAGFQSHPGYQKLIEFLIILQAENVQWTWLDAVCINQTNREEKDHEIQHMGDYYQRATGCHVLQHGFSQGFELYLPESDGRGDAPAAMTSLPRWFTRAWTFQEWLLPPKVTFILDLAADRWLRVMASRLLLYRDRVAWSKCLICRIHTFLVHIYLDECERQCYPGEESLSIAFARFREEGGFCEKSHENSHFRDIPGRSQWYFVDDVGYAFLLRLQVYLKNMVLYVDKDMSGRDIGDAEIELMRRLGAKEAIMIDPDAYDWLGVVTEIAMRDCSNAEDRVLSVLKLLGVQNLMQVRTGNTLNVQILHLVHSYFKAGQEQLLVPWCLKDSFGSETPGMSWMPEFAIKRESWQDEARSLAMCFKVFIHDSYEAEMRCLGVSPEGVLNVEAYVCNATLVTGSTSTSCEGHLSIGGLIACCKAMALEVEGQVIFDLYLHVFRDHLTTGHLVTGSKDENMVHIAFEMLDDGLPDIGKASYPIWLLKAGIGQLPRLSHICWLVCVEYCPSTLHKIGYFYIDTKDANRVSTMASHSQKVQCSIGGLGRMYLFGAATNQPSS